MNKNSLSCTQALLALWRAPGIGCSTLLRIMTQFNELEEIFHLSKLELEKLGLKEESILYIRSPNWKGVEQDLAWLDHPTHHLVHYLEERYPPLLKEISNAPPLLFVAGDTKALAMQQLSIVGSRNPTPRGSEIALQFAYELSQMGLTITSGLALGIDASGHRGALKAKKATIAILGSGPDQIYPKQHEILAEEIVQQGGAIVSEFSVKMEALPENFPRRNRIVSGLAMGTLIVEATLRSGSLITARLAGEQGREVFAVPGSIYSPLSKGCHSLIRQGAKLVETTQDILEELNALKNLNNSSRHDKSLGKQTVRLDVTCQKLLEYIDEAPTTVDYLVEHTGFSPQQLLPKLFELEMQGLICATARGYQKRSR